MTTAIRFHYAAIWWGIVCSLIFASCLGGAEEEARAWRQVETDLAVTTMMPMADARQAVLGHTKDNKVTVWDLATGRMTQEINVAAPSSLLSRGGKLFVGAEDKGLVRVFDESTWKLVGQLDTGGIRVGTLTAPQGENFTGEILAEILYANPLDKPSDINPGRRIRKLVLLDFASDKHHTVVEEASMPGVDFAGESFFCMYRSSLSSRRLYNYRTALEGEAAMTLDVGLRANPSHPLYQVRPGRYWYAGNTAYSGSPLRAIETDEARLIVPDLTQPVFYKIKSGEIEAVVESHDQPSIEQRKFSLQSLGDLRKQPPFWKPPHQDIAVTQGDTLYLWIYAVRASGETEIRTTQLPAFRPAKHLLPDVAGPGALPEWIPLDQPFEFHLYGNGVDGDFRVINGPTGVTISPQGQLTWQPTHEHIGPHQVKIRAKIDGSITFKTISLNVAEVVAAGNDSSGAGGSTVHEAGGPGDWLTFGHENATILWLSGNQLRVLDTGGNKVLRSHRFAEPVDRIFERDEYFVALSRTGVMLLDKDSFAARKHFKKPGEPNDLAIHPHRNVSFVAMGTGGLGVDAYPIYTVDEASGVWQPIDGGFGKHLTIDPLGRHLYVALAAHYRAGSSIDWDMLRVRPAYGRFDATFCLNVQGGRFRALRTIGNLRPGAPSSFVVALDGSFVSTTGGKPAGSNFLPVYPAGEIRRAAAIYDAGGTPTSVSFHPYLSVAASSTGKEIRFFDRSSGSRLNSWAEFNDVKLADDGIWKLLFAPDGRHLIIGYTDLKKGPLLVSLPLQMTASQVEQMTRERAILHQAVLPSGDVIGADQLQAFHAPGQQAPLSSKEISARYQLSVVQIRSRQTQGTGLVVGSQGYILTAASVVPHNGEMTVSYNAGSRSAQAQLVRLDTSGDLALLKIPTKEALPVVQMTQGELADLGERITIISHPRLGEKILSETMTTGIVSRASRTFDGLAYLQIAAAVNPGSEGAPVFDSHGHVIGVVMATGSEEDVGFATPNQRITNFLKTSSPPADEAPQAMRVWRDASGKHSMTAQLVSFEKELVQLKRADGKVVEVPLGFLGEADQQFLRDWVSANGP